MSLNTSLPAFLDPLLEDNQPEEDFEEEQTPTSKKKKNAEPKITQQRNYSDKEDIQLCELWLDVTQDPVVGTNQTGDGFWNCITKKYMIANPCGTQEPLVHPSRSHQQVLGVYPQKRFCAYCLLQNPGQRSKVEQVHHEPPEQIGLPKAKAPGHNYHHCRFVGTP
ncbi:hypothetical protein PCANC_03847 [Puccinia coronata f. sp. avenae]|uniref:Uncharacterized protein n=1 Tax=Puccinia coronata f. sp. avenae TaxID=200324 RepID=A0A2N5T7J0_9BASI|nr:hypothetical protein PCANC_03847 [Puccinia coronata f. sp. avenae]